MGSNVYESCENEKPNYLASYTQGATGQYRCSILELWVRIMTPGA